MRFAYTINELTTTNASITLFNSSEAGDSPDSMAKVSIFWYRSANNQPWKFNSISILDINSDVSRLLRNLKASFHETSKVSPLRMVMELAGNSAKQVVYDERLKKYRNVSTMKEGEDTFAAIGVKGIVVSAANEEAAVGRVKKLITNAMMENPKAAGELAGWFTNGCKVSKLTSGSLPDVVGREALAGPGEKELASKPVVISPLKKKAIKKD